MICATRARRTVEEQNSANKTRGRLLADSELSYKRFFLSQMFYSGMEGNLIQRHDYNISDID